MQSCFNCGKIIEDKIFNEEKAAGGGYVFIHTVCPSSEPKPEQKETWEENLRKLKIRHRLQENEQWTGSPQYYLPVEETFDLFRSELKAKDREFVEELKKIKHSPYIETVGGLEKLISKYEV